MRVAIVLLSLYSAGCANSGAFARGVLEGMNGVQSSPVQKELLVFGGDNHTEFLGCLTCSAMDRTSVFNQYGIHGSPYGRASIANHFSANGNAYGRHSACNPYAADPPVVVDREGHYYGTLTVNETNLRRFTNIETLAWLAATCAR